MSLTIVLIIICVICYFALLSMINAHLKRKDDIASMKVFMDAMAKTNALNDYISKEDVMKKLYNSTKK